MDRKELAVCGKKIYKSELELEDQDVIIVMSDGVPHAGIGKLLNFGWDRDDIIDYMKFSTKHQEAIREHTE